MPCRQHRTDDLPTRLAAMQQWRKDNAIRLEQLQLLAAGEDDGPFGIKLQPRDGEGRLGADPTLLRMAEGGFEGGVARCARGPSHGVRRLPTEEGRLMRRP